MTDLITPIQVQHQSIPIQTDFAREPKPTSAAVPRGRSAKTLATAPVDDAAHALLRTPAAALEPAPPVPPALSDGFWAAVEPLLPVPERDPGCAYVRRPGGGRKAKPARLVMEAIVFVLSGKRQWKDLPADRFGSWSVAQQKYMLWSREGVFDAIWATGLAQSRELAGVAWAWQRLGPSMLSPWAEPAHSPGVPAHGYVWRPVVAGGHRNRRRGAPLHAAAQPGAGGSQPRSPALECGSASLPGQ